jgi:hypothetical protein
VRVSKSRPVLVVLGWGVSLASLAVTVVARAVLVPHAGVVFSSETTLLIALYYAGVFSVSFLSGLMLRSLPSAVLGFFCAYALGILLAGLAFDLPGLLGLLPETVAEYSAIVFAFTALFPLALLVGLVGGLLGAATTEP